MRLQRLHFATLTLLVPALLFAAKVVAQKESTTGEWRSFAGDLGSTRYSPLAEITRENVQNLRIVWRRPALDSALSGAFPDMKIPANLRTTPLMIDGVLYASNAVGLVEAFDAGSGKTLWVQEPLEKTEEWLRSAQSQRGVAYWQDRILSVRGEYLNALDRRTGKLMPDFGRNGSVSLRENASPRLRQFFWYSAPLVVRDVVIVGMRVSDSPPIKEDPPGDVRGYDVRTGALRWTFHVIPQEGEFGVETWQNDSWRYTGAANMWGHASADEELGYVYLPLSTPTNDWYGGHRPGNNLFAESIVCLDAATGKRVWHFQVAHHGLWDYDLTAAPILADITVGGRRIKAVVQLTKQNFAFVFDRVTGEPVWPIEERPVARSSVPGEWTSPTQPFPIKPAPYDRQGISVDDLIDFTPELRSQALDIANKYVVGPLYTPPTVIGEGGKQGIIMVPGWMGGNDWNGGGFDSETGLLYVPSVTAPNSVGLMKGNPEDTNFNYVWLRRDLVGPQGLPLLKPPYGRLTAINLNTGEHVWMVPNGDGPRNHPLLKPLNLPPLGQPGRASPLVTKTLVFLAEGSEAMLAVPPGGGGSGLRAFDKATGAVVWETQLPAGATGPPITYMFQGKQYIVLAIGGTTSPPEFVALGLGQASRTN